MSIGFMQPYHLYNGVEHLQIWITQRFCTNPPDTKGQMCVCNTWRSMHPCICVCVYVDYEF